MRFFKNPSQVCVSGTASISDLLVSMEQGTVKFRCVTSESGSVTGVVSYGDITRALMNPAFSLENSADSITNRAFAYATADASWAELRILLERHRFVPILDETKSFRALLTGSTKTSQFSISHHDILKPEDFILIAEIGNNHNGSLELARELVRQAKRSGAHIAKFQMCELDSLYGAEGCSQDLSIEYVINLLRKVSLSDEDMYRCFDYCHELGVTPLCTPFDSPSLEKLETYGMEGYKTASADLINQPLYRAVVATDKPIISSTGMSTDEDIDGALQILEQAHSNYALLHTNSTYPTPFKDVHLNCLKNLKERTCSVVGYSGHERGWHIPLAAYAVGAQIIEKHFTLDKSMEGNDHRVSLLPEEFSQLRKSLDDLAVSMGDGHRRLVSQGESNSKIALSKSVFCASALKEHDVISEEHLCVRSPGNGISPRYYQQLLGSTAVRDIEPGEALYMTDLSGNRMGAVDTYPLNFKWGIPVRHRDVYKLYDEFAAPLIEFHLSFKDLELVDEDILTRKLDTEVIVHAP